MNKKIIALIVIDLVVIIGAFYLLSHHSSTKVGLVAGSGEPTEYDNVSLTGSLVTGVSPNTYPPALPLNYVTGTVYAGGDLIQGGTCSATDSSAANTSITLTAAQLQCTSLSITTATTAALTVNVPTQSGLTFLANVGDETDTYIYAASTTGGGLVITGTSTGGFTVNTASSSATIPGGQVGALYADRVGASTVVGILVP